MGSHSHVSTDLEEAVFACCEQASVVCEINSEVNNLWNKHGNMGGYYSDNMHLFSLKKEAYCQSLLYLLPLIWPCFHSSTWHSSWWAVIYPEAELTASVRLKLQMVNGTVPQLRKAKLTFSMFFNFYFLCSYISFLYCILCHPWKWFSCIYLSPLHFRKQAH